MTKKETDKVIKKIKIAMAEEFITQTELAKKLGRTQGAISAWFKGRGSPDLETLMQVSDILKKPINYFFDNSGSIKGNNNVVSSNNNSVPADVEKDIKLLTAKIAALESKIENLELKYNLLKKENK